MNILEKSGFIPYDESYLNNEMIVKIKFSKVYVLKSSVPGLRVEWEAKGQQTGRSVTFQLWGASLQ